MSDIQRYALQTELSEDSLGKWVRYEDHLDEVAWAVSEVLDAAREAVAAVENNPDAEIDYDRDYRQDPSGNTRNPRMWMRDALAAIDALRGDA